MSEKDAWTYPPKVLIGWFWRGYARYAVPSLLAAFLFMAVEGASLGALSWMVRPMFDDVFVAGDRSAVFWVSFIVCALFIGRAIASIAQRILMAIAGRIIAVRMQSELLDHMLTLDPQFFQDHGPGELMERVRGDTAGTVTLVTSTLSAVGRDVLALISLLAVAVSIDWVWTLVAIAGGPLVVFPVMFLQRLIRRFARQARVLASEVNTRLNETFHGIDTVKLNATEEFESGRFRTLARKAARVMVKNSAAQAGIPALMDVIAAIGFLGVLTIGGIQIIEGEKTIGDFMAFFTAIALVFDPVRRLGAVSGVWQRSLVSIERVYDIFQREPKIVSPANPRPLPSGPGPFGLELKDVSFAYGELPVLDHVSFRAEAGQTTALVGASGAGKTTIFRALTRLLDPDEGQVQLDGVDIREFAVSDLRQQFSVVTQDTQLFDESIRANVLLGTDAEDEALNAALEASHVSEFLPGQAEGLDTRAGPRGSALSGGQRQRVAIARALLRDAPFLLLDEATSALDTKSEAVVQDALEKLSSGRTTLVIAHRLSTVRNADKIIVMDKGRVADQGTHDELMARDGLYAMLYNMQFRETETGGQ